MCCTACCRCGSDAVEMGRGPPSLTVVTCVVRWQYQRALSHNSIFAAWFWCADCSTGMMYPTAFSVEAFCCRRGLGGVLTYARTFGCRPPFRATPFLPSKRINAPIQYHNKYPGSHAYDWCMFCNDGVDGAEASFVSLAHLLACTLWCSPFVARGR